MTQALMEKMREREPLARGKDGGLPAIGCAGDNCREFCCDSLSGYLPDCEEVSFMFLVSSTQRVPGDECAYGERGRGQSRTEASVLSPEERLNRGPHFPRRWKPRMKPCPKRCQATQADLTERNDLSLWRRTRTSQAEVTRKHTIAQ